MLMEGLALQAKKLSYLVSDRLRQIEDCFALSQGVAAALRRIVASATMEKALFRIARSLEELSLPNERGWLEEMQVR